MTYPQHLHWIRDNHNDNPLDVICHNQLVTYGVLDRLERKLSIIMAILDTITAAVTESTTVDASALALIQGIAAQLTTAAGDPAAVQALADQLTASSTALAAAVAANTPAASPAPETPPVA